MGGKEEKTEVCYFPLLRGEANSVALKYSDGLFCSFQVSLTECVRGNLSFLSYSATLWPEKVMLRVFSYVSVTFCLTDSQHAQLFKNSHSHRLKPAGSLMKRLMDDAFL